MTQTSHNGAPAGRRVVITGIGALTPIGTGVEGLWAGLKRRESAVRTISRFDPSPFRSHIAAQVDDFEPTDYMDRNRARRTERYAQFALAASRLAIEDAGLDPSAEDPERAGVLMGSALGGVAYGENQFTNYVHKGVRGVDPMLALAVFNGAASCNVAIEYGFSGPNSTNGMSCASGAMAIGEGWRAIRTGEADMIIAGGVEAPLAPLCYGAFAIIRAMSTRNDDPSRASRPFDADRDGFVMAEGASVLVLEELERARARGARIYAEVLGYGTSNDAHHMTAPRPDGTQAGRAMRTAMRTGGVALEDVQVINAHASSTPLNDSTESRAIRAVFGEHTDKLKVSGTKGYHGHSLGATGAIEAAISALSIQRGWVAPTLNLETPGEDCTLDYVTGEGLEMPVRRILSNSFGFGGINAALMFGSVD
ncbi:beta-ketoacyl-ACP synthase II [Longimicrobium terrae]|uniref:3-oxoacyl-[acyl-carrier-protein] synthase 2 n=1 Tax=Longimicrobium terrae TaxID=1639882 RepID=A0A841GM75_9BACT|nr:beta-ketoacyl-ACP synthase II [Longimicrobium terrae]MBB4635324.1 3-oxoacyl-[acyl-carrier-protein] synthase II [Longimicrobium terrae]MBB6069717.1 3-oxoacyl-[acyl-carrier-protein] synthase II [Longimicrobium terrae]NNC31072.1 beta-ketoacyl-ACP synthase II [Longimicrobium terrae]